jgi:Asp/Glu/hydantoin racemase
MKVQGGKPVFGVSLGILMLESCFPRIPGDMGNAQTWPFPVFYRVVQAATPDRVVRQQAEGLLPAFIDAGRELVQQGVEAITTNCGFLAIYQDQLAEVLDVPVAASSLMQARTIKAMLPLSKQVGIITIDSTSLSDEHLRQAQVPEGTPIVGTEQGEELSRVILNSEPAMDVEAARRDIHAAGDKLQAENPDVGAILLECTNMCPYAADLRRRTGLPVFDIYTFINWLHLALQPNLFPSPESTY